MLDHILINVTGSSRFRDVCGPLNLSHRTSDGRYKVGNRHRCGCRLRRRRTVVGGRTWVEHGLAFGVQEQQRRPARSALVICAYYGVWMCQ